MVDNSLCLGKSTQVHRTANTKLKSRHNQSVLNSQTYQQNNTSYLITVQLHKQQHHASVKLDLYANTSSLLMTKSIFLFTENVSCL